MTTRLLLINEDVRTKIKAAKERATAKIVPREVLVKYADTVDQVSFSLDKRNHDVVKEYGPSPVYIPQGYNACFSIEDQPIGLVRHLSVSVDSDGMCPNEYAMDLIAEEFGFVKDGGVHIFVEEYQKGRYAVNYIQLITHEAETTTKQ